MPWFKSCLICARIVVYQPPVREFPPDKRGIVTCTNDQQRVMDDPELADAVYALVMYEAPRDHKKRLKDAR